MAPVMVIASQYPLSVRMLRGTEVIVFAASWDTTYTPYLPPCPAPVEPGKGWDEPRLCRTHPYGRAPGLPWERTPEAPDYLKTQQDANARTARVLARHRKAHRPPVPQKVWHRTRSRCFR